MIDFGMFLYALLVALAIMFWRAVRGRSLDELIERGSHDHHEVHRVIDKHPIGGSWREHKLWMREEASKSTESDD